MAEYIKRETLVDLVLGKLRFMGDARIMNKGDEKVLSEIDGYEKAIYAVHELLLDKDLIEDIQPVKRGHWIDIHEYCKMNGYIPSGVALYFWCSECMKEQEKTSDFCPCCGADMREQEAIKG